MFDTKDACALLGEILQRHRLCICYLLYSLSLEGAIFIRTDKTEIILFKLIYMICTQAWTTVFLKTNCQQASDHVTNPAGDLQGSTIAATCHGFTMVTKVSPKPLVWGVRWCWGQAWPMSYLRSWPTTCTQMTELSTRRTCVSTSTGTAARDTPCTR